MTVKTTTNKEKQPKLTFKTTEEVRAAVKVLVAAKNQTIDRYLHDLVTEHLEQNGRLQAIATLK